MAEIEVPCAECGMMCGYSKTEYDEMIAYGTAPLCVRCEKEITARAD